MILLAKPVCGGNELLLMTVTILVGDHNNLRVFLINRETYDSSDAKTDGNFTFPKDYAKQHPTLVYGK